MMRTPLADFINSLLVERLGTFTPPARLHDRTHGQNNKNAAAKSTSVTMRKNAPRRLGSIQAHLLAA
jgi:hypothetical protein